MKLGHLEESQKEMKSVIKDLSNTMEKKFDKMDSKFGKTNSKIDRLLYAIISGLVGLVLKGGLDFYLNDMSLVLSDLLDRGTG